MSRARRGPETSPRMFLICSQSALKCCSTLADRGSRMAVELHVMFAGKLPSKAALTRAMKELGFPVSIPAGGGALDKQRGFLPMKLRGRRAASSSTSTTIVRTSRKRRARMSTRASSAWPAFAGAAPKTRCCARCAPPPRWRSSSMVSCSTRKAAVGRAGDRTGARDSRQRQAAGPALRHASGRHQAIPQAAPGAAQRSRRGRADASHPPGAAPAARRLLRSDQRQISFLHNRVRPAALRTSGQPRLRHVF